MVGGAVLWCFFFLIHFPRLFCWRSADLTAPKRPRQSRSASCDQFSTCSYKVLSWGFIDVQIPGRKNDGHEINKKWLWWTKFCRTLGCLEWCHRWGNLYQLVHSVHWLYWTRVGNQFTLWQSVTLSWWQGWLHFWSSNSIHLGWNAPSPGPSSCPWRDKHG